MKKSVILILAILLSLPGVFAFDFDVLNTDPAPLEADDYADITVRLTQDDTDFDTQDITLSLVENKFITVIGDKEKTIKNFNSAASITRTFRVYLSPDIPEGDMEFHFKVTSATIGQEFRENIFVSEADSLPDLRIGQMETVPDEILRDTDDNKLIVTLQNLGETEAEMVSVTMNVHSKFVTPSYSFSLTDSVSSIGAGEEAELEFTFDMEEEATQDLPLSFDVQYRSRRSATDSYRVFEKTLKDVLPLANSPYLEVVNVTYDKLVSGTTDNKIQVTVANNGNKEAESVRIRLQPDISYPFIFDATTHYISSELDPGEQASFEMEAEVTGEALTRDYPVAVELESLVSETLYSREDTVTLSTIEGRETSNGSVGTLMIGLVVAIALGFGVYNLFFRKKK